MKTLKHGAGYLEIDHTNSPGIRPEDVAHLPGVEAVGGGRKFETDTKTCSHCQRLVVLHPQRQRERAYCPKCNSYICDGCETIRIASGYQCVPFKQVLDRAATVAEKFVDQPDHPDAKVDLKELTAPSVPSVVVPRSIT